MTVPLSWGTCDSILGKLGESSLTKRLKMLVIGSIGCYYDRERDREDGVSRMEGGTWPGRSDPGTVQAPGNFSFLKKVLCLLCFAMPP